MLIDDYTDEQLLTLFDTEMAANMPADRSSVSVINTDPSNSDRILTASLTGISDPSKENIFSINLDVMSEYKSVAVEEDIISAFNEFAVFINDNIVANSVQNIHALLESTIQAQLPSATVRAGGGNTVLGRVQITEPLLDKEYTFDPAALTSDPLIVDAGNIMAFNFTTELNAEKAAAGPGQWV